MPPKHDHRSHVVSRVGCAIVTVSDTRTVADDASGALIRSGLEAAGHAVHGHAIVPDDPVAIRGEVAAAGARPEIAAIIVTGGTGIAPRDVTIEALAGLWSKELPGFGELFRALSYEEIGAAAFLTRATAGIIAGRFVAVLPGSPNACRLAMERLVLPELVHVASLLLPP